MSDEMPVGFHFAQETYFLFKFLHSIFAEMPYSNRISRTNCFHGMRLGYANQRDFIYVTADFGAGTRDALTNAHQIRVDGFLEDASAHRDDFIMLVGLRFRGLPFVE